MTEIEAVGICIWQAVGIRARTWHYYFTLHLPLNLKNHSLFETDSSKWDWKQGRWAYDLLTDHVIELTDGAIGSVVITHPSASDLSMAALVSLGLTSLDGWRSVHMIPDSATILLWRRPIPSSVLVSPVYITIFQFIVHGFLIALPSCHYISWPTKLQASTSLGPRRIWDNPGMVKLSL